jgi:hypothetical protein
VKDCVAPGANDTLGGETLTTMCASTVICALAVCDGLAWLTAESATGFGAGTDAGARYSTLPAGAVVTTTQGLEPTTQTCPTNVLPPAIPPTCHVTFAFALPEILAVNICRWLTARVAESGDNEMLAELVSVTLAVLEMLGFAWLVARTVTIAGDGSDAGAV